MKPIQKIVVAVDFSETSDRALDAAIAFAKQLGAELHIVHAYELPVPLVSPYEIAVPDAYLTETRNVAASKLQAAVDRAEGDGVKCSSHLAEVPAARAIAGTASDVGADLIVVGTHGHTGLKHTLLGSVAERTARIAPCSVLVVKKDD